MAEASKIQIQDILLVEDNHINIYVAQQMLEQAGLTVDVSLNGAEALKQLALKPYDAILMDLEMPVMNGLEATEALRQGKAGTLNQQKPVIAVTAHALPEYEKKALMAGIDEFITKPINFSELITSIKQVVKNKFQET